MVSALQLQAQHGKVLQKQRSNSDTITARFSMNETVRGDTVMFKDPSGKDGILRYFRRNLRYPFEDSIVTIPCKFYFIIDTTGHVTKAWCADGTVAAVCKEVIRIAEKLPIVQPSYVKGKSVATLVETRLVFTADDAATISKWDNYETDILMICSIQYKK